MVVCLEVVALVGRVGVVGWVELSCRFSFSFFFFFQAEDGIRDHCVTGVQTCALPIYSDDLEVRLRAGRAIRAIRAGKGERQRTKEAGADDEQRQAAGSRPARRRPAHVSRGVELTFGPDRSEERRVGKARRHAGWQQE